MKPIDKTSPIETAGFPRRPCGFEWVPDPEGPAPKGVAIIHCVGSRDTNHNHYCSRVCCMYSLKFAHLVREKLPAAACYEFYLDMRAFGKGYEEFMERIKSEGVHVVRGRSANVSEANGQMVVKGEDMLNDRVVDFPVDLVILAVGVVPAPGNRKLASMLGVPRRITGEGVGIVAAMRGTLTHHYTCDTNGICTSANLIVGTTNNNAPIQMVTKKVAQVLIQPGKEPNGGILNMIEMAFRAFDPCYSCATRSLPGQMPLMVSIYRRGELYRRFQR